MFGKEFNRTYFYTSSISNNSAPIITDLHALVDHLTEGEGLISQLGPASV